MGAWSAPAAAVTGAYRAAATGAGLSNLINNLPAYTAVEAVVPAGNQDQLLALLIGTNVGPVITPWASLATLLWFEWCRRSGVRVPMRTFVPGRGRAGRGRRGRDRGRAAAHRLILSPTSSSRSSRSPGRLATKSCPSPDSGASKGVPSKAVTSAPASRAISTPAGRSTIPVR